MRVSRIVPPVLAGAAVAGAAFVVGMRRKSPVLQDRIRRFSRDVGTPMALRTAGRSGLANGVVRHVGRRSGAEYATPVTPFPVPGGFLVALPYTRKVDWARNVLAAGTATLEFDGRSHTVTDPEVVAYDEVAALLPRSARVVARVFDLREFLRLRVA